MEILVNEETVVAEMMFFFWLVGLKHYDNLSILFSI